MAHMALKENGVNLRGCSSIDEDDDSFDLFEEDPQFFIEDDILPDFQVSSELELQEKLIRDFGTLPCVVCGKEFEFNDIHFRHGDPYCADCIEQK